MTFKKSLVPYLWHPPTWLAQPGFLHHGLHLFHERRDVVGNPLFDRPLDAASPLDFDFGIARNERTVVVEGLAVISENIGAVGDEQTQIFDRVAVDDQEVGDEPLTDEIRRMSPFCCPGPLVEQDARCNELVTGALSPPFFGLRPVGADVADSRCSGRQVKNRNSFSAAAAGSAS